MALTPIDMTGQQVRDLCMPRMQGGLRKQRLCADLANIEAEEDALRVAVSAQRHRALVPSVAVSLDISADMKWFYENRLRGSVPGRVVWHSIVDLAGRLCPLCHLTRPRTIEHSFPQSAYPRLATEPLNMVPACRDCNSERNVGHGTITISPYFDAWVVVLPWLHAEVIDHNHPEDLRFSVIRHASFTDDQWDALGQFVVDVKLLDRYVGLAIEAFSEFVAGLRITYPTPSADDAERILEDKVLSQMNSFGINRWQTVAFEAWHRAAKSIDWASTG